jgi:hypothetical protein
MPAIDIGWTSIAPNSSVEWFIHGWGHKDAVTYAIVVFPGTGRGVPFPGASATLIQGKFYKWFVDGTFAQTINIQNNEPFNSIDVHLIASVQSLA